MQNQVPAQSYPSNIFKSTTPDEEQALTDSPRFQTWYKGWLTRSEIYERQLPDNLTSALRIDGPGDSAFSLDDKGNIRILTGVRDPEKGPGSGVLGIKTWGQQQLHNERSNLQFSSGSDDEGQALNILCYGDYVEESKGSTRYIKAEKIMITAASELILDAGSIKLQAESDILLAGTSVTTSAVNKKEIVTGQTKTQGAGENTTEQYDPRATTVINTPGSLQQNIAQDYQLVVGGAYYVTAAGGPGTLIKDRVFGIAMKTGTDFAVGGVKSTGIYSSGFMDIYTTAEAEFAATDTQFTTANFELDAAKVDILGSADITIKSAVNVNIQGTLIFLN